MVDKVEAAITQTHITTLQNIISRLSNYSMNCKTWAVTIVSALCVIIFDPQKVTYFYVVIIPIILFWLFDCYYLGLEKVFRIIYNDFLKNIRDDTTSIYDDIQFSVKRKRLINFFKAMSSTSTTPLYGILAGIVVLLYHIVK
jgi:hypothetical protein